jgi:hypothetical protein
MRDIRAEIRKIDPNAKVEVHPSILYALRCEVSDPSLFGPVILRMEQIRGIGVLIVYVVNDKDFTGRIEIEIQPQSLNLWQRFVRRIA